MQSLADFKNAYMRAAVLWKQMKQQAIEAERVGDTEKQNACNSAANVYARQYTLLKSEAVKLYPQAYHQVPESAVEPGNES